ncbi:MAG: hypothetical protein ACF8LL_04105 [Phycisphaerales bacterium]
MPSPPAQLNRELGLFGAVLLGLGSIVGTGVLASSVIGAQTTGASVLVAIAIAGVVAVCHVCSIRVRLSPSPSRMMSVPSAP